MASPTLSDLVTTKTRDECFALMLAALASVGFPTASWHSTSVPYRLLMAMAHVYALLYTLVASVAAGGLLEYATGLWLTLLARSMYGLTRYAAVFTKGTLTIKDTSGAGPYNITANQLWFATTSGKRFHNTAAFTIPLNGSVSFEVVAESAGASYNVPTDDIVQLTTPLPGVGYDTGEASYNPATDWITTTGTDEESDALLSQRCSDQWATLGYGQNDDWWRYYARNAPTYGASVTRVKVSTDPVGTGLVTLTLAGPTGAISALALSGIDAYLQAIKANTTMLVVQNASNLTVAPTGTAYVFSAYISGAGTNIEESLDDLFAGLDIGATGYLTQITDAIQWDSAKVRNVDLTAPAADVVPTATQVLVRGTIAGLTITAV